MACGYKLVECVSMSTSLTTGEISVRLAPAVGIPTSAGRLEISTDNETWETVCTRNFNERNANIMCRKLNFAGVLEYFNSSEIIGYEKRLSLDSYHTSD